jgi:hypothetical protein
MAGLDHVGLLVLECTEVALIVFGCAAHAYLSSITADCLVQTASQL